MRTVMIPLAGTLLSLALVAGPVHAAPHVALPAPPLLVDDDDDDGRRWMRPRHVDKHYYPFAPRHYFRDDEDDNDGQRHRSWRYRRRSDDDDGDDD